MRIILIGRIEINLVEVLPDPRVVGFRKDLNVKTELLEFSEAFFYFDSGYGLNDELKIVVMVLVCEIGSK